MYALSTQRIEIRPLPYRYKFTQFYLRGCREYNEGTSSLRPSILEGSNLTSVAHTKLDRDYNRDAFYFHMSGKSSRSDTRPFPT